MSTRLDLKDTSVMTFEFTDGSSIRLEGESARVFWLAIRYTPDLLQALIECGGRYFEAGISIPLRHIDDCTGEAGGTA